MGTAWRWSLVVALAAVGQGVAAGPASGAQGTRCTGSFIMILEPGLSTQPSTGKHYSESPGKIDCDGPVNGKKANGTGTLTQEGRYGTTDPDSCQSGGEADGTDHFSIPTAGGPEKIDSPFTATFGRLSNKNGFFGGEFKGSRFSGSFKIQPLEGDCVSRPVTKARVDFDGVFHD
jgi:hypothetical protein